MWQFPYNMKERTSKCLLNHLLIRIFKVKVVTLYCSEKDFFSQTLLFKTAHKLEVIIKVIMVDVICCVEVRVVSNI